MLPQEGPTHFYLWVWLLSIDASSGGTNPFLSMGMAIDASSGGTNPFLSMGMAIDASLGGTNPFLSMGMAIDASSGGTNPFLSMAMADFFWTKGAIAPLNTPLLTISLKVPPIEYIASPVLSTAIVNLFGNAYNRWLLLPRTLQLRNEGLSCLQCSICRGGRVNSTPKFSLTGLVV